MTNNFIIVGWCVMMMMDIYDDDDDDDAHGEVRCYIYINEQK